MSYSLSTGRHVDTAPLRNRMQGRVLTRADAEFQTVAFGGLWNELRPERAPDLIACVSNDQDVVEAIKFARQNDLKVVVRGGGHNWCCPSLRNGGMMIDLTAFNQVISIDPSARRAIVQPIVSNRQMMRHLQRHGLAYPVGHCPEVKLSGYLLSGGMSWNQGVWGHGFESVEAIEMVTANGEMITADKNNHSDYFWAARGGGPEMFAVATRYHLKLCALPKAISTSFYYYPVKRLRDLAGWLDRLAAQLPSSVELSIFMVAAPPELAERCRADNGKVCLVTAVVFADSEQEARETLRPLDTEAHQFGELSGTAATPIDFEGLFDASGALWPSGLRSQVDAIFSNSTLVQVCDAIGDYWLTGSTETVVMFAVFTGRNVPAPVTDEAAFSMTGKLYGGPWTMWRKAEDDAANIKWHRELMQRISPHIIGHYVSETNTVDFPEYEKAAYSPAKWQRLKELREKYDPEQRFFSYSDGLK